MQLTRLEIALRRRIYDCSPLGTIAFSIETAYTSIELCAGFEVQRRLVLVAVHTEEPMLPESSGAGCEVSHNLAGASPKNLRNCSSVAPGSGSIRGLVPA